MDLLLCVVDFPIVVATFISDTRIKQCARIFIDSNCKSDKETTSKHFLSLPNSRRAMEILNQKMTEKGKSFF